MGAVCNPANASQVCSDNAYGQLGVQCECASFCPVLPCFMQQIHAICTCWMFLRWISTAAQLPHTDILLFSCQVQLKQFLLLRVSTCCALPRMASVL